MWQKKQMDLFGQVKEKEMSQRWGWRQKSESVPKVGQKSPNWAAKWWRSEAQMSHKAPKDRRWGGLSQRRGGTDRNRLWRKSDIKILRAERRQSASGNSVGCFFLVFFAAEFEFFLNRIFIFFTCSIGLLYRQIKTNIVFWVPVWTEMCRRLKPNPCSSEIRGLHAEVLKEDHGPDSSYGTLKTWKLCVLMGSHVGDGLAVNSGEI